MDSTPQGVTQFVMQIVKGVQMKEVFGHQESRQITTEFWEEFSIIAQIEIHLSQGVPSDSKIIFLLLSKVKGK